VEIPRLAKKKHCFTKRKTDSPSQKGRGMGTRNLEGHGSERNVTLNDRERILEEKEEESER